MDVVMKRMPNSNSRYRLMFRERADERPQEIYIDGDDELRTFLDKRLEQPTAAISRVISELNVNGNSFLERLPWDANEVKNILRELEAARKLAEVEARKSAGRTVQPV